MVGEDILGMSRCFDIKGSIHSRITKLEPGSEWDSGAKVLKDQNFLQMQKEKPVQIGQIDKISLIEILKKDSLFLRENQLIDYSLFMLEISRQKKLRNQYDHKFRALQFDSNTGQYLVKEFDEKDHVEAFGKQTSMIEGVNIEPSNDVSGGPQSPTSTGTSRLNSVKKVVYNKLDSIEKTKRVAQLGKKKDSFMDLESEDGGFRYKF